MLEAIAESAFKTSDYPVILSLENHCSPKQQAKIAAYCHKIFGDMLLTDPLLTHPLKQGIPLPSPNQLLRKIIIKNKKKHHVGRRKQATTGAAVTATTAATLATTGGGSAVASPGGNNLTGGGAESATASPSMAANRLPTGNSSEDSTTLEILPPPSSNILTTTATPGSTCSAITAHTVSAAAIASHTHSSTANPLANNSCELDECDSDTSLEEEDGGGPSSDACIPSLQSGAAVAAGPATLTTVSALVGTATSANFNAAIQPAAPGTPHGTQPAYVGPVPVSAGAVKTQHIKESEAAEELSALVNYIEAAPFHSFEYAEKRNRSYETSSFSETQATSLLKERPVDFVNFNKRQLSRIYPRATRLESSNYMPQVFWNAGCQMVALNYQTLDLGMQLNLGIFEYNARCGYLLKPDFMRRADRKFDPFTESTVDGIIAGTVTIQIISAQLLNCDKKTGTYVEVDMFGLPADTARRRRTRTVSANSMNPIYYFDYERPFVFSKVVLPDLACIRLGAFSI